MSRYSRLKLQFMFINIRFLVYDRAGYQKEGSLTLNDLK